MLVPKEQVNISHMDKIENSFRTKKLLIDPTSKRFPIFLSQSKDCSFDLDLYCKLRSSNNQLLYGDNLIRLEHTESKALLGADLAMTSPFTEIYARNYEGTFEEEKNTLDTIWEIEHIRYDKRGKSFSCKILNNNIN
jgi:hypothetical protein